MSGDEAVYPEMIGAVPELYTNFAGSGAFRHSLLTCLTDVVKKKKNARNLAKNHVDDSKQLIFAPVEVYP